LIVPGLLFNSNPEIGAAMSQLLEALGPMAQSIRENPDMSSHFVKGLFADLEDRRVWPSDRAAE
jgi:hypothetical protein